MALPISPGYSGIEVFPHPVQVTIGALIIKERLGTSDEETVEEIRENSYLQYFIGCYGYKDEPSFEPSIFVH